MTNAATKAGRRRASSMTGFYDLMEQKSKQPGPVTRCPQLHRNGKLGVVISMRVYYLGAAAILVKEIEPG